MRDAIQDIVNLEGLVANSSNPKGHNDLHGELHRLRIKHAEDRFLVSILQEVVSDLDAKEVGERNELIHAKVCGLRSFLIGREKSSPWLQAKIMVMGAVIGVFVGLSATPIVGTVVCFLISFFAIVQSFKPSSSGKDTKEAKPPEDYRFTGVQIPQGCEVTLGLSLSISILFGSVVGVISRTNDLLGVYPKVAALKWTAAGLSSEQVAEGMFRSVYSTPSPDDDKLTQSASSLAGRGVLLDNAITVQDIQRISQAPPEKLFHVFSLVGNDELRELAAAIGNITDADLKQDMITRLQLLILSSKDGD